MFFSTLSCGRRTLAGIQMMLFPRGNSGAGSLFGALNRVRSGFGFWSLSRYGFGPRSRIRGRAWSRSGSRSGSGSQIETLKIFVSQTRNTNLKLTNISALNPRVLSSKQRRVGFKLKTNQLEVGQELKWEFAQVIKPGVPIFMLKEAEIAAGIIRKKMNFCLVYEEFWLVFK